MNVSSFVSASAHSDPFFVVSEKDFCLTMDLSAKDVQAMITTGQLPPFTYVFGNKRGWNKTVFDHHAMNLYSSLIEIKDCALATVDHISMKEREFLAANERLRQRQAEIVEERRGVEPVRFGSLLAGVMCDIKTRSDNGTQ